MKEIPVTLILTYIESDSHAPNITMFRLYRNEKLIIEPSIRQKLVLTNDVFFIERIEQNLKEEKIILYQDVEISHYKFWSKKDKFREEYLPPLLNKGWREIVTN